MKMSPDTFRQIASLIGNMESTDDLAVVSRLLKDQHSFIQRRTAASLGTGSRVKFKSRSGETVTGVVTKINQKTITLVTDSGATWKVSPTLCSRA